MNFDNTITEEEENEEEVEDGRDGVDTKSNIIVDSVGNGGVAEIMPYSGGYLKRSVPPTCLMVAWRLFRLKAYNSNRNMGTVSLDKLCVNLRMDLAVAEILLVFAMVRESIIRMEEQLSPQM
jgi:hypothetical protein